jgi:hypothetical protein
MTVEVGAECDILEGPWDTERRCARYVAATKTNVEHDHDTPCYSPLLCDELVLCYGQGGRIGKEKHQLGSKILQNSGRE